MVAMRRTGLTPFLLSLAITSLHAQSTTALVDVDHRAATSLNGEWHYIVDPYRSGATDYLGRAHASGYARDPQP